MDDTKQLRSLINRMSAGDSDAYDELANQASERLRGLAHAMLRDYPQVKRWEDTDDILQATLIRLHRSLCEVRPGSTREFYGLAALQIRRSLLDLVRHYYGPQGHGANHHSQGGGKAADDSGGVLVDACDEDSAPGSLDDWVAFHEAVEALPKDQREVFELIWYSGMKRCDVATLVGVDQKTVLRRFTRARVALQQTLGSDAMGD